MTVEPELKEEEEITSCELKSSLAGISSTGSLIATAQAGTCRPLPSCELGVCGVEQPIAIIAVVTIERMILVFIAASMLGQGHHLKGKRCANR